MTGRRTATQLRAVPDPAWPAVQDLIAGSSAHPEVLPAAPPRSDVALEALQVTTRSYLGALVDRCGAVLLDSGWLRVLGAGAAGLPGIHEANRLDGTPPALLEVARDVLGGRFAIDGGALGASPGDVCYWGPDTLEWSSLGGGYTSFVTWALSGGTADFYAPLRWHGWQQEVRALPADHSLAVYPPPFTAEGRDLGRATRRAVPTTELQHHYSEIADQMEDVSDGSPFRLRAGP